MIITCGKMSATVDAAQLAELEGLSAWQADLSYILEFDGKETPETRRTRDNVEFCLCQLDMMRVPFWVQNLALAFGRDWRRTRQTGLVEWIKTRPGYSVKEEWTV